MPKRNPQPHLKKSRLKSLFHAVEKFLDATKVSPFEKDNMITLVYKVNLKASKMDVKKYYYKTFGFYPENVNTLILKGKTKKTRTGSYKTSTIKKAFIKINLDDQKNNLKFKEHLRVYSPEIHGYSDSDLGQIKEEK